MYTMIFPLNLKFDILRKQRNHMVDKTGCKEAKIIVIRII